MGFEVTHAQALQGKQNLVSLPGVGNPCQTILFVNDHGRAGLGPRLGEAVSFASLYSPSRPLPVAFRKSAATFENWQVTNHYESRIAAWPLNAKDMSDWYRRRKRTDLEIWQRAGIADLLDLCFRLSPKGGNRCALMPLVCYWNPFANTFDFKFGQASVTLLDMHAILGFPLGEKPFDAADYSQQDFPSTTLPQCETSWSKWISTFANREDDVGGIAFLDFWLNKFIFCSTSNKMTTTYKRMAELMYAGEEIGLAQIVLGHLYRCLHTLSATPLNCNKVSGPLWILEIWSQIYFPALASPNIRKVSENEILGLSCVGCDPKYGMCYAQCFDTIFNTDVDSFFSSAQAVLERRHPSALKDGFMPSQDQSERGRKLFLKCVSMADLPLLSGEKGEKGFEAYTPHLFARQLGLTQLLPFPPYGTINMFSAWRPGKDTCSDDCANSVSKLQQTDMPVPIQDKCLKLEISLEVAADYSRWWESVTGKFFRDYSLDYFRSIFTKHQILTVDDRDILARRRHLYQDIEPEKGSQKNKGKKKSPHSASAPVPQKRGREETDPDGQVTALVRKKRNISKPSISTSTSNPMIGLSSGISGSSSTAEAIKPSGSGTTVPITKTLPEEAVAEGPEAEIDKEAVANVSLQPTRDPTPLGSLSADTCISGSSSTSLATEPSAPGTTPLTTTTLPDEQVALASTALENSPKLQPLLHQEDTSSAPEPTRDPTPQESCRETEPPHGLGVIDMDGQDVPQLSPEVNADVGKNLDVLASTALVNLPRPQLQGHQEDTNSAPEEKEISDGISNADACGDRILAVSLLSQDLHSKEVAAAPSHILPAPAQSDVFAGIPSLEEDPLMAIPEPKGDPPEIEEAWEFMNQLGSLDPTEHDVEAKIHSSIQVLQGLVNTWPQHVQMEVRKLLQELPEILNNLRDCLGNLPSKEIKTSNSQTAFAGAQNEYSEYLSTVKGKQTDDAQMIVRLEMEKSLIDKRIETIKARQSDRRREANERRLGLTSLKSETEEAQNALTKLRHQISYLKSKFRRVGVNVCEIMELVCMGPNGNL